MIKELKTYEALRPSGDPWLGEIPKRWSQKRLWSVSSPRVERNSGNLPLLSVFLDRGVILYGEGGGQVHAPSLDLSNYQVVHPGDFVLNNQQAWRGSVGVSRHHGIISPAYIVLRISGELLPAYANYLFRCPRLVDQFVAASKGVGDIQRQVFWPFLRGVTVPIPSTTEQEAIVRFLDHANRRIDQFIRAKKKLIALLNEQKQAIIHRAVTRGLAPDVELKPSAVPGLATIPAHWKELRARFVFRVVTRRDVRPTDPKLSVTQRRGIVRTADMTENSTQARSFDNFQVCHPGDLVLNKYKAHLGVFWMAPERGLITPNYTVFRAVDRVDTRYFEHLFHTATYRDLFKTIVYGVTEGMSPLYSQDFYRTMVLCPPEAEQRRIVEWIPTATTVQDLAMAKAESEIKLLQEYRTRLISDVVTGHLDVRAAAAGLPVVEPEAALIESEGDETDIEDGEAE